MKPFLTLILSLSFTLSAFGQQDSGFTNKAEAKNLMVDDKKEGKWVEYMDFKTMPSSDTNYYYYLLVIYKQNYPVGIVHGYYKNGKLYCVFLNKNGLRNGVSKCYYESGKLWWEIPFKNGKLNGTVTEYYESGLVKAVTICKKGKQGKTINYSDTF
jgi:hypothetical protein